MEKDKKFRALAIAAICVAIVGVSVAYAALQATLSITGTATVNTTGAWGVKFVGVDSTTKTTGVTYTSAPEAEGTDITWAATFTAPGDSLTIKAKIENTGTIPAKLNKVTKACEVSAVDVANAALASNFECTATYGSEQLSTKAGSVLPGKTTTTGFVTIVVKLKDTVDNTVFTNLDKNQFKFETSLDWVQADSANNTFDV